MTYKRDQPYLIAAFEKRVGQVSIGQNQLHAHIERFQIQIAQYHSNVAADRFVDELIQLERLQDSMRQVQIVFPVVLGVELQTESFSGAMKSHILTCVPYTSLFRPFSSTRAERAAFSME